MVIKLKYLDPQVFQLDPTGVNLQSCLGLQTATSMDDVCSILNDVRLHERIRILERVQYLIDTREITDLQSLNTWIAHIQDGLELPGDNEILSPSQFESTSGKTKV